jgi:hypothetical protein
MDVNTYTLAAGERARLPPPQPTPAPSPPQCGFHGPGGVFVLEEALRATIGAVALTERNIWFDRVSSAFQKEGADARFGDLVRYWLQGHTETIRPGKLKAIQQAALDPSITYGNLSNLALNTAIQAFGVAEAAFNAWAKDVYRKSDTVDLISGQLEAARQHVKLAAATLKAAKGRAALNDAKSALRLAENDRKGASRALDAVRKDLEVAKGRHDRAKADRDKLKAAAQNWEETEKKAVRKAILTIAGATLATAGMPDAQDVDKRVEEELQLAHQSRADIEAWSAVFVVFCVREAAIGRNLEAMGGGGTHLGRNNLLKASRRHADYIVEARERKRKAEGGTYHAFDATAPRIVQIGDIICTDRTDFIDKPAHLKSLEQRSLQGDIVSLIESKNGSPVYAETIGGNVGHTVRRRRYPLDVTGRLIVSGDRLFAQEDDTGAFGNFATLAPAPTKLNPLSTGRIFALLSLVEECRPKSGPTVPSKLPSTRKKEGFVNGLLDGLETPFLDQEILQSEPQYELDYGVERLLEESPFGGFLLAPQTTRYDSNQSTRFLADSVVANEFEGDLTEFDQELDSAHEDDYAQEEVALYPGREALTEEWEEDSSVDDAEYDEAVDFEQGEKDLAAADTLDERAAQPTFAQTIRDRIEPLLDAKRVEEASTWNSTYHPGISAIDTSALRTQFGRYLDIEAIEKIMGARVEYRELASNPDAVLAVLAHQFQQKIYASSNYHSGKIAEGTLDALGFVRHRGDSLNDADALNQKFHVRGGSKAFNRIKEIYNGDKAVFDALGSDVSPKSWYCLFVNAPFLGRPFEKGIHVELMRRLRQAESWLLGRPRYQGMSPVELGVALNINEDHHGGRTKNNSSMHTLGLAVDIGYFKNPWVAGQADSPTRNTYFQGVSKNVSRLLSGTEEVLTSRWLASLGADPSHSTEAAYNQIQQRHMSFQVYLSLENDAESLKTAIHRGSQGLRPERVIDRGETIDAAAKRWCRIIKGDRVNLQFAFGANRVPSAGFLNLERDLVVALRDHGCLAWGAIDLGPNQSGDMMHFDCRAMGIGWKLAFERQRTVGAGHPCSSKTAEAREEL